MSSLYASRWADTPPAEETPQKSSEPLLFTPKGAELSPPSEPDQNRDAGIFASRWADIPPPLMESVAEVAEGEKSEVAGEEDIDTETAPVAEESAESINEDRPAEIIEQTEPSNEVAEISTETQEKEEPARELIVDEPLATPEPPNDVTPLPPLSPSKSRLDAPRLKKKVSWRGKTCVISIPSLDYAALGLVKPLTHDEIIQRVEEFEAAGYNTDGFDMLPEVEGTDDSVHAKPIYPDETESRTRLSEGKPNVMLPDLDKWRKYMDHLTEQKLASLGVSIGPEEPAAASPQDISRQASAQYPPLPFSPPIPAGSAASLTRPGLVRGHSHAMSVASPVSPLNGPFGHAHRHSVFTGPFGFQQVQQPSFSGSPLFPPQDQQPTPQSLLAGVRSLSPQSQMAIPGFNRATSPALLAALRNEFGNVRSAGSPLAQQIFTPDALAQRQQNGYFNQIPQALPNPTFTPGGLNSMPIHNLPQLPEEDDEDELLEEPEQESEQQPAPRPEPQQEPPQEARPEKMAYVPPHRRAELNANIAVPTPRGHRHNISEGFERDILEAEKRNEARSQDYIVVEEESSSGSGSDQKTTASNPQITPEKDPLSQDYAVQEIVHSTKAVHKKTASRFNVAAPAFKFNPGASFQPAAAAKPVPTTAFTFGANPTTQVDQRPAFGHARGQSSGTFNVDAPEFKPVGVFSQLPKTEFSFSTGGPSFKPAEPPSSAAKSEASVTSAGGSSIFGKIQIPDFIKPARRSKAIAIRKPSDSTSKPAESGTEPEDEDGRVVQSEDRLKRQRKVGDDGDEVPRFAEPTPMPAPAAQFILKSQKQETDELNNSSSDDQFRAGASHIADDSAKDAADDAFDHEFDRTYGRRSAQGRHSRHHHSSSLSALAKPFEPHGRGASLQSHPPPDVSEADDDLEEGELVEDEQPLASPPRSRKSSVVRSIHRDETAGDLPIGMEGYRESSPVLDAEPSFAEIDAVMRQLNEPDVDIDVQEPSVVSPLPSSLIHPMPGVTYLTGWERSDAPSPSPQRRSVLPDPHADSSFTMHERADTPDSPKQPWPQVNRLNRAAEIPTSDWSADFSVQDDEKLHQRSNFLDNHIDNLIGRVLEKRLQPLEDSLQAIQNSIDRRPTSRDLALKRSSSAVDSDADDEDELSGDTRQRPISRGKDKRTDQIKAAVLEALHQSSPPRRSEPSFDLQDLHSYLADMKASFARAASSALELDDIRAIVEDAVGKQSESLAPIISDANAREGHRQHSITQLSSRVDHSLASLSQEVNLRREMEQREAEAQRALRVVEEDLRVMRDATRESDARIAAVSRERDELLRRAEGAEDIQSDLKNQVKNLEKENAATYATLEEYRTSSSKWRQHIDEATSAREALDAQLAELRHKVQQKDESIREMAEEVDVATSQRDELKDTVDALARQLEEAQESGSSMKNRLEKLHSDMATAAGQLASEKAISKTKEEELNRQIAVLEARARVDSQARSGLEEQLREAQTSEKEVPADTSELDQLRTSNSSLEEMMQKLQGELAEQQSRAKQFEREAGEAKEAGRVEVQRVRVSLETDVETANHQVNVVRVELETELTRLRGELENARLDAEMTKARNERLLEDETAAKKEALDKINQDHSVALHDAHLRHEASLEELRAIHDRALGHAVEDKQRSEYFLNERLALSDAKLQHFQDKVLHLEERLEVAKTAAQAAAMSAKSRGVSAAPIARSSLPDKISPQALRESILVLQEQLQDRESQIERLQNEVDNDGPAKLKSRDDEIAWLRELLSVRGEELTNLINTLSRPSFDRAAVRNAAIRLRANLDMEQQEKDRSSQNQASLSEQAMASLSNFSTPKAAAQLTSAFNKWRSTMESSALKSGPPSSRGVRASYTPSKAAHSSSAAPLGYVSGLMTPPTSNVRSSPSPEAMTSLPPPRLNSRPTSKASNHASAPVAPSMGSRQPSTALEGSTTPLFRPQSYDEDAADSKIQMESLDDVLGDDDLDDMADDEPPAFRSLGAELEDAGVED